jgi:HlyD family secretion protein
MANASHDSALPPVRRRGTRARRIVRAALLGLVVAGLALLPRALKPKPIAVKVVRVERATVRDEVSSSTAGEVRPALRATVRAEIGARVVAVRHKRGDRVKRGDVVVALDGADLEARLQQAVATLRAQEVAIGQVRARVATATRQAERARTLAERGAGTTQLSEDAQAVAKEAEEALRAAEAQRGQAEAAVRVARVARGKAELTAPFDGLLVEVLPDPGEQIAPGAPVFEIIDDRSLRVEATVDEADAAKVKIGQAAMLRLDALPKPIAGRVTQVAPAVRRDLKGARVLPIEVEVADVPAALAAGLKPGMSANVEITVAEKRDVPSLPTSAVVGRGLRRTVFFVERGGVARVRPVEVGVQNWERSEILGGLKVGDTVISSLNVKGLEDGVAVRTTELAP